MKISARLRQLDAMAGAQYQHIWDCCCDHGLLGMLLLKRRAAETVHFVDIVPALMDTLEAKLQHFFPEQVGYWQVHCADVASLRLPQVDRQLVIIAGVGGEQCLAMVESLRATHPGLPLDFLLCPVRHCFQLRSALVDSGLGLISEYLLEDNGRYYECLHLSSRASRTLTCVGDQIWAKAGDIQCGYLAKLLSHYQHQGDSVALEAYPQLATRYGLAGC